MTYAIETLTRELDRLDDTYNLVKGSELLEQTIPAITNRKKAKELREAIELLKNK
jgi:hypothetical protein